MIVLHIRPSEIEIGERVRNDLGDIGDLEKSIRKLGLIQPIGITKDKKLIWGWRRLETWKKVKGDEPIAAIVFPEESAKLAELAENLCRLNLPWQLKNTAIAEFHKQLEKQAESEFSSDSEEKSGRAGRPPKPWSQEDTAEVLGISTGKVSTAISLAKAIEEHPGLKHVETEEKALEMLRRLKEPGIEKPKTFKCRACLREYAYPVQPLKVTLCPFCEIELQMFVQEMRNAKRI
ncbi:MAG: ParB N-terminal domain-containing protein [Candidatus Bathyarchaeia archaeon]